MDVLELRDQVCIVTGAASGKAPDVPRDPSLERDLPFRQIAHNR
jgi:hypothetical protein